jgi:hypothetical protein
MEAALACWPRPPRQGRSQRHLQDRPHPGRLATAVAQGLAGDLPVLGKELSARLQNLTRSQIEMKTRGSPPQHPLDACGAARVRQEVDATLAAWGFETAPRPTVWLTASCRSAAARGQQSTTCCSS